MTVLTVLRKSTTGDLADVRTINMDAGRDPVVEQVGDAVDIAFGRLDHIDFASVQNGSLAEGLDRAAAGGKMLDPLCPARGTDNAPNAMIMDGSNLSWPPYEADDREPIAGIDKQPVLLIVSLIDPKPRAIEPTAVSHQFSHRFDKPVCRCFGIAEPIHSVVHLLAEIGQGAENGEVRMRYETLAQSERTLPNSKAWRAFHRASP